MPAADMSRKASTEISPVKGILSLIGHTPMVEITRFDTGPCRLFAKMESHNPGGSIKDRIAFSMVAAAEHSGQLKPGGTIVEATAGNTGLGLALIAALKGYKVILVVPDKMSREKVLHCKALGADVRITRSDVGKGHPDYYQDMAERIAAETGGYYINQFSNPANPLAHETGTAPEVWAQMEHKVDAVVCGVGSGGTVTGMGRFFKRVSPATEMVLADPEGSVLAPLVATGKVVPAGSWVIEGIGEDFVPDVLDLPLITRAYSISDAESLAATQALLQQEGILAGPSSGTSFAAALRYCRAQTEPRRVVTFICDRGDKYLSKSFSRFWMTEQGFAARPSTGTVEDLVMRRHDAGDTVTVRVDDTLSTAYKRLRLADVSQLPVLDAQGKLAGMLDERALLERWLADAAGLEDVVAAAMRAAEPMVSAHTPLAQAGQLLLDHARLVVVSGEGHFLGLVTRVDFLNHMHLRGQAR